LVFAFGFGFSKKYVYDYDELKDIISSKLNVSLEEADKFIPFTPNDKIKEIADTVRMSTSSTPKSKVNLILRTILGKGALDIEYEKGAALNAYQVLIQRSANCIAYTNLFVSIAREVGMDAVFVDVTQVRNYGSDEIFYYREGHICAGIKASGQIYLVDFVYDSKDYKKYRVIDDLEAIANFLTILGVESEKIYIKTGEKEYVNKAYYYHRAALSLQPRFLRAANNLGVLYLKERNFPAARKMFEYTLKIDDEMNVARYNLAELHLRMGDTARAQEILEENVDKSIRDPYTHLRLGQIYFSQKKLEKAEYHLRKAIRFNSNFVKPRLSLLALLLSQQRLEDAEDLLDESEKMFPGNKTIMNYRNILKKNDLTFTRNTQIGQR
jgi:Flp pilus assembly protein TadD